MNAAILRNQLLAEIQDIPENRLEELHNLLRFFRNGLEHSSSELLVDIIKELPEFPSFKNKDPLELQREMRDDWN